MSDPVKVPEVEEGDCPLYCGLEVAADDHVKSKDDSYCGIVNEVD